MSTADDWELDPDRLKESLARWHAQHPRHTNRRFVDEFLMDLIKLGPFECGEEDSDTGIFTGIAGGVVGSTMVIVYVPDLQKRRIAVVDISGG